MLAAAAVVAAGAVIVATFRAGQGPALMGQAVQAQIVWNQGIPPCVTVADWSEASAAYVVGNYSGFLAIASNCPEKTPEWIQRRHQTEQQRMTRLVKVCDHAGRAVRQRKFNRAWRLCSEGRKVLEGANLEYWGRVDDWNALLRPISCMHSLVSEGQFKTAEALWKRVQEEDANEAGAHWLVYIRAIREQGHELWEQGDRKGALVHFKRAADEHRRLTPHPGDFSETSFYEQRAKLAARNSA